MKMQNLSLEHMVPVSLPKKFFKQYEKYSIY